MRGEHVDPLVARRLHRFYTLCPDAGLPELERLAATVETGGR
jgi:hypothetical protein